MLMMLGAVGTMDYNAEAGLKDKPIVYYLAFGGVFLLLFGSYYAHVLAVRLEKYGRC